MQLLDPIRIPLTANALIEASAGTGKTYTITTLYLRAILGLVDSDADTLAPLSIEQILVVTFTEAATQEIKDRVRKKLKEAQQLILALCDDNEDASKADPILTAIINEYTRRLHLLAPAVAEQPFGSYLAAYHKLQDAITLIDEASIFTIHGFCHRCLKQFAFETKASFEQEFDMDAKPIWQQAIYDFWRQSAGPLASHEFEWFRRYWKAPNSLFNELAPLLNKQVWISPSIDHNKYRQLMAEHQRLVVAVKETWRSQAFSKVLLDSGLKRNSKSIKRLPVIDKFIESDLWIADLDKTDGWQIFGSVVLQDPKQYKAKAAIIDHPICPLIDQLIDVEHKLSQGYVKAYWLNTAKQYVEGRAKSLKVEAGIINPDDLLTELRDAIEQQEASGPLLEAIRGQYPLAFIDEFQDTDPIQYAIFDAIYGEQAVLDDATELEAASANMLLIGDPKQAIYKFRGADIYTYILAKSQMQASQCYTLGKNWRSHPSLIQAVNEVFSRSDSGFEHEAIPFSPVTAGKPDDHCLLEGDNRAPVFECFYLNPDPSEGDKAIGFKAQDGEALMAKWCAEDIKKRLSSGQHRGGIQKGKDYSPLKAGEICILVRNRHQAGLIKRTLAKQGIQSVYISRDSIFASELALDLLRLLLAIHSPNKETLVRGAIAGRIFDYPLDQLAALQRQPRDWQCHLGWFFQASDYWHKGKVALAIDSLLQRANTFEKWQLTWPDEANRMITDLRHLLELLQQQAVRHAGPEKLLHWFEQQVLDDSAWADTSQEQQLRLESDSNLVQIATLHASKGLEYPVVYLPFICEVKPAKTALFHSKSEQSGLTYRVDNRTQELQIAEQERLAEDIRLLYVAMTRPVFSLILGLFPLLDSYKRAVMTKTAIGRILFGEQTQNPGEEAINKVWQELSDKFSRHDNGASQKLRLVARSAEQVDHAFRHAMAELMSPSGAQQCLDSQVKVRQFNGRIDTNWGILSYSALAQAGHHAHEAVTSNPDDSVYVELPGGTDENHDRSLSADANSEAQQAEVVYNQFTFPKGANAGTCLHWMFENLDFSQPVKEQQSIIAEGLTKYGFDLVWLDTVSDWMQRALNYQLGGHRLSDIPSQAMKVEMEFYFDFSHLSSVVLGNALRMVGVSETQLERGYSGQFASQGVLKGFIDLTYRVDGKYYVLDYKSNFLGDDIQAYQKGHLEQAMSDHNYFLQALIYLLALHRFLEARLDNYDFDRHIGGALYYFVRGVPTETGLSAEGVDETGIYRPLVTKEAVLHLDNALRNGTENDKTPIAATPLETATGQIGFNFD